MWRNGVRVISPKYNPTRPTTNPRHVALNLAAGRRPSRPPACEYLTLGDVLGRPWREAGPMLRRRRRKGVESARQQRIAKKAARRALASALAAHNQRADRTSQEWVG